jgi:hypothetical protein
LADRQTDKGSRQTDRLTKVLGRNFRLAGDAWKADKLTVFPGRLTDYTGRLADRQTERGAWHADKITGIRIRHIA